MNYGPLEFAVYLKRKGDQQPDSAAVEAARAAAPSHHPEQNRLTVVSGQTLLTRFAGGAHAEAVSVYEAVAVHAPGGVRVRTPVKVLVRDILRPVVLVLSSHRPVEWELAIAPGASLRAALLSGFGQSTIAGAGDAVVASIGGFYAFKLGSAEFGHLESEIMRCTGCRIGTFRSVYAGNSFEIG